MAELFDEIFVAKDFKYFIKKPEAAEPVLQQSQAREASQKEADSVKSVELPSLETWRADHEEQDSADFNFKEVRLPNAISGRVTSVKQSKELDAVFDPSDHSVASASQQTNYQKMLTERLTPIDLVTQKTKSIQRKAKAISGD